MKGEAFYRREFLNNDQQGGHAFIEAHIEEARDGGYLDAEFSIADCNRIVSLYFGSCSAEDSVNIRAKIKKLRLAVVAFEKALLPQLDARDLIDRNKKK